MTRRGWLLFAAVGLIWGIPYLLIKVAVDEVSPAVVVLARTGLGALLLLPFALRRGGWATLRGHWWAVLAFAVLELMGPWFLLSNAERTLDSSTTGLLVAMVPVLGVVAVRLSGDSSRIGPARWTGLAIGLLGVGVLAAPTLDGGGAWPVTQVLLAAIGYAIAPIIASRYLQAVPGLVLTTVCLAITAVVYAPIAALNWPSSMPSSSALWSLLGLAALCTALGLALFFALISEVGPARAVVVAYVNPAVAVAAGALVLDEAVTASTVIAFALILVGSVLATSRPRDEEAAAAAAPEPILVPDIGCQDCEDDEAAKRADQFSGKSPTTPSSSSRAMSM
jgi:drug/metabolite transporter (DMT)-like permease